MKRIFTVTIFAAMFMAIAWAEAHWTLFSEGVNGSKSYLDYQTIKRQTQDSARVWTKIQEPAGDYWVGHIQLYRPTRQYKSLQVCHYNSSGEVINSISTPSDWAEAIPDSFADRLLQAIFPEKTTYY